MRLSREADEAEARGEHDEARAIRRAAFEKEAAAAELLKNNGAAEPTRSVLYRSAAVLALRCGLKKESVKLAAAGLSGNPRPDIADELMKILDDAAMDRHFDIRGVTLSDDEFQMSLDTGGFAPASEVSNRILTTESGIYRMIEFKNNIPYSERGNPDIRKQYTIGVSAPRLQSFAVSFQIATPKNTGLFGRENGSQVIAEWFNCLDMFAMNNSDALKRSIDNADYYNNFVGLARELSPDGREIKAVGFTTFVKGQERRSVLAMPRSTSSLELIAVTDRNPTGAAVPIRRPVHIVGELKFADSRRAGADMIELVAKPGGRTKRYRVRVPRGMMADIVRSKFDQMVEIEGTQIGGATGIIDLEKIQTGRQLTLFDSAKTRTK